ncbi:MAG: YegS/Rv2252/BmrU family lipid kinase [Chitinophagaceae bacterium]
MNRNIAILCNRLAGSGRSVQLGEKISFELSKHSLAYTIFVNDWPQAFLEFTDIFIAGGDGTLNYFINKYPEIKLPLVIFNGGTGNDFHWMLYSDKSFDEQMQIALFEKPKAVDIGKCNDRYFINGIGIGFEAAVAKALIGRKKLPGKASFYISVLNNILVYKSKNYSLKISDKTFSGKYLLIDIYNGKRSGGGFYIAPKAEPDDGLFEFISVEALTSLQRLRYLPVIEKGKHLRLRFINYIKTDKIEIESDSLIQFHLDGEYREAEKIEIKILPAQLNFRF